MLNACLPQALAVHPREMLRAPVLVKVGLRAVSLDSVVF